jgi:G6PDH family F420-dependent oxidoreductase
MKIGYFLSSEEWGPRDSVALAGKAERAGFEGLWISDHYHPRNEQQGHSPFVWSVIGAIAQATTDMKLTTAVTCPTVRLHPGIVAQAAATAAILLDGRFCLGLGSGEALNEHIFGDRWPGADERLEMLEEAVEVIRKLWQGGVNDHVGPHYRLEHWRVYHDRRWRRRQDLDRHVDAIKAYADAGFDELYIQQIGPRQDEFFEIYRDYLLPRVR